MSKTGTFYDVLQLRPGAAADDVRKAYRRLARENHPDAGAPDTGAMALINQAYETLSDPDRRADYDRELTRPAGGGRRPGRVEMPGERRRRRLMVGAAAVVLVAAGAGAAWFWPDEPDGASAADAAGRPVVEMQMPVAPAPPAARETVPAEPALRLTATHQLSRVPAAPAASAAGATATLGR